MNLNHGYNKYDNSVKKNMSSLILSLRRCPMNLFPAFESIRRRLVIIILLLFHIAQASYVSRDHRTLSLKTGPLPTFAETELEEHRARVGNTVSFSCAVKDLGNYKVAWLHADKGTLAVHPQVITQNERLSVSTDSRNTYILSIRDIKESDAGKYICQINTGPPQISISGSINVVVPPNIIDESSSSDTLATEGMRVTLSCHAEGNPIPTIKWRREDRNEIKLCDEKNSFESTSNSFNVNGGRANQRSGCRNVKEYEGADLVLNQISRFDSGVYLCIAENDVSPIVSKRVMLYVDFPPTLWITHQLVGVDIGGTVKIDCLTAAHPPSINYWSREGGKHLMPHQNKGKYKMEVEKGKPAFYNKLMKLHIYNITQGDLGKYKCLAKNPQGETSGEIELYEAIKPSTTTSSYADQNYDYPIKEIKTIRNEDCVGDMCTNSIDGLGKNIHTLEEGGQQRNNKDNWKKGKKHNRRRKNGRKYRKNRKRGQMDSDADPEYGNNWDNNRNDMNDYDGDESPSSFHRETSHKYQLNLGISTCIPRLQWHLFSLVSVYWLFFNVV